jgi:hypothetical protein
LQASAASFLDVLTFYRNALSQKRRQRGGRAEFIGILEAHLDDRGFCSDMEQLLRTGADYDAQKAGEYVKATLLKLLSE